MNAKTRVSRLFALPAATQWQPPKDPHPDRIARRLFVTWLKGFYWGAVGALQGLYMGSMRALYGFHKGSGFSIAIKFNKNRQTYFKCSLSNIFDISKEQY